MSPVRRSALARATAAAVVVCCLAMAGCSGSTASERSPTAAPSEAVDSGIALDDVDTTALAVPRAPFCDQVDPAAVARALGEEPGDVSAYRSGQRIKISDDVADVVHEYGCRWTAGDGAAEAWVFAPPVTRKRAAALVRGAQGGECTDVPGEPTFGQPTGACLSAAPDRGRTVALHGLFGDAWLSCSLTLAGAAEQVLTDRALRWCAAVATGAAS